MTWPDTSSSGAVVRYSTGGSTKWGMYRLADVIGARISRNPSSCDLAGLAVPVVGAELVGVDELFTPRRRLEHAPASRCGTVGGLRRSRVGVDLRCQVSELAGRFELAVGVADLRVERFATRAPDPS